MKCRDCGEIMHPVKNSNFSFYRVSRFHCGNEDCPNDDEVYLTHCINHRCHEIIDSRDSAKCQPEGFSQERYGWYVCPYCYACCNTTKLKQREHNLDKVGRTYSGHKKGHQHHDDEDKNKWCDDICCPDCGSLLVKKSHVNSDKANEWFAHNKDNKKYIQKSGENTRGRWYLLKQSGFPSEDIFKAKLNALKELSFTVEASYFPQVYMIGEPTRNQVSWICSIPECSHELDVSKIIDDHDYDRLNALRYHRHIHSAFPYQKNVNLEE